MRVLPQKVFTQRVAQVRGLEAGQTANRNRLEDSFQTILKHAFSSVL